MYIKQYVFLKGCTLLGQKVLGGEKLALILNSSLYFICIYFIICIFFSLFFLQTLVLRVDFQ